VVFLDGKRATYLRGEVMARNLSVARYAQRRAAAWASCGRVWVIDTLVGSCAWRIAGEGLG
jgi:hypothetical protein